jgi:hypothetical protein
MLGRLIVVVLLALLVTAVIKALPDIRRYIRMRRM